MRGLFEHFARVAIGFVVVAAAGVAQAQQKWFGDWVVGCDNVRSCTAIGVAPRVGNAYVKVDRSGEPEAAATVTFVLPSEKPAAKTAILQLAFDDPSVAGLPAMPVPATVEHDDREDVEILRATLSGEPADAFIDALRRAERLTVTPIRGQDKKEEVTVSLSGAVAAIRFMDERQKRAGTVTALLAKGGKPASSVPAPPPLPVVVVKPIEPIEPRPRPPKALPSPCSSDDDFNRIAVRLSPLLTLWGTCRGMGAYNIFYDFYLVSDGKIARAHFEPNPGEKVARDHTLLNPSFSRDSISAIGRERGIGDCGVRGEWAWDGRRFRLLAYAEMDDCQRILPVDWPVLYRAEREH